MVERFERDCNRAGRILVANLADWATAGKVLSQVGAKYRYDQVGKGRLTNDALIAMSAGRVGFIVITVNEENCATGGIPAVPVSDSPIREPRRGSSGFR